MKKDGTAVKGESNWKGRMGSGKEGKKGGREDKGQICLTPGDTPIILYFARLKNDF